MASLHPVPHTPLPGQPAVEVWHVEVWHEGVFIATVTASEGAGVRVASAHQIAARRVVPPSGPEPANMIEVLVEGL